MWPLCGLTWLVVLHGAGRSMGGSRGCTVLPGGAEPSCCLQLCGPGSCRRVVWGPQLPALCARGAADAFVGLRTGLKRQFQNLVCALVRLSKEKESCLLISVLGVPSPLQAVRELCFSSPCHLPLGQAPAGLGLPS